jgi:hypothetical protein
MEGDHFDKWKGDIKANDKIIVILIYEVHQNGLGKSLIKLVFHCLLR